MLLILRGNSTVLVQLGGLEPPTSCSTDRRSNQLSYNCIMLARPKRTANGAETRCNAPLWQGHNDPLSRAAWSFQTAILWSLHLIASFGSTAIGRGHRPDLIAAKARLKIANPDRGARVDRFSANRRLSNGRLEQFRRASPDRLGSLRRNFLGQFGQFLGLDRERSELIAGMGAP